MEKYKAIYARHYGRYSADRDTLEEAKGFLEYQSEMGELFPIAILHNNIIVWQHEDFTKEDIQNDLSKITEQG